MMNEQMRINLEKVITSLINDDSKGAQSNIHEYIRAKSQAIILGEEADEEDKKDDDKDDEESDKDEKEDKKDDDKDDEE